jgi:hypothetical protein
VRGNRIVAVLEVQVTSIPTPRDETTAAVIAP